MQFKASSYFIYPAILLFQFVGYISCKSLESTNTNAQSGRSANFRLLEEPRVDLLTNRGSYDEIPIIPPYAALQNPLQNSHEFVREIPKNWHDSVSNNFKGLESPIQTEVSPRFAVKQRGPSRRQDTTTASPGLDLTSVSPIESSFGGLTGLQGLPPLSLIQFVKLLVAVTPFILPLVFVPLLIFTLGIFMIPVKNMKFFFGKDQDPNFPRSSSGSNTTWSEWGSSFLDPVQNFARTVLNHEECLEKFTCEMGRRYFPWNPTISKDKDVSSRDILHRSVLKRILHYFNHPLTARISRSLEISPDVCAKKSCGVVTFVRKHWLGSPAGKSGSSVQISTSK